MKFSELSSEDYRKFVSNLHPEEKNSSWGYIERGFIMIAPSIEDKKFPLKQKLKPSELGVGIYSEYLENAREKFAKRAMKKIRDNELQGTYYLSDEGSFKLHIGLNGIQEVDVSVINGLTELLVNQARSAKDMSFIFKIVQPEKMKSLNDDRFINNDQFTLYFDKYSSVAEMMKLCTEVNKYLMQHLDENKKPFGAKDIIGFNSFVTGRFDTSKLDQNYAVFTFYDKQLKKFFERYKGKEAQLADVPLWAFEVVFNNLLIDPSIKDLNKDTFDERYGQRVQEELDLIVKDPINYIKNYELSAKKTPSNLSVQTNEANRNIKEQPIKNTSEITKEEEAGLWKQVKSIAAHYKQGIKDTSVILKRDEKGRCYFEFKDTTSGLFWNWKVERSAQYKAYFFYDNLKGKNIQKAFSHEGKKIYIVDKEVLSNWTPEKQESTNTQNKLK